MNKQKIIALDCDDVLLDYNHAWGELYTKFFNLKPFDSPHNPFAYHAADYWRISWKGRETEEKAFMDYFTYNGWRNMKPVEGAIEATHILHDYGYKIFIVSRMPKHGEKDRTENLHDLKFKFDSVIGTGHTTEINPKKPYIEALNPEYFVDDLIRNFENIKSNTKFVWLDIGRFNADNEELKNTYSIHHTHETLHHFVTSVIKK